MSDLRLWEDDYLRNTQYKDASRLNARLQLHQRFSTIGYDYYRWLFDLMLASFPVNARILEVGAGSGELWLKNLDRIPDQWHITLTDFAPGILADAQRALGNIERIAFQEADVQQLPFADQHFDAVLAHLMLYHIPHLAKAIKEIRRVLTPQGSLHAVTLGKAHMHQLNVLADPFVPEVGLTKRGEDRAFSLENGATKLLRRFGEVQLIRWTDHLHVTEVEPLVDYVLSMTRVVTDKAIAGLRAAFASDIQRDGKFEVLRDTGLFVARGYPLAKE